MVRNSQIDILTTLIPETSNDRVLEKKNPLLKLIERKDFKFHIFNKTYELPKKSKYLELISKEYETKKRKRPLLSDYYKDDLTDWIIISNSDIIFFCNVREIINKCDQKNIGFASARRFDSENLDLFLKNPINSFNIKKYLKDHCKFQSKRTLDFFILKRDILKDILFNKSELNLIPGTVLFDLE